MLNSQGEWVYEDTGEPVNKEDTRDKGDSSGSGGNGGGGSMGNPDDGTDEGIDKDWWRGLPGRSILDAIAGIHGPTDDDRESRPRFDFSALPQLNAIVAVAPQAISVDERGETIQIDLTGAQGNPQASGTGTTDGWGDRPRTWAEAAAAPRIRDGSLARF